MGQLFLTPPPTTSEGRWDEHFAFSVFNLQEGARKEPGRHGEVQKGLDRFWLSGIPSSPAALAFSAFVSIFVAARTHFYLLDSPAALLVPTPVRSFIQLSVKGGGDVWLCRSA